MKKDLDITNVERWVYVELVAEFRQFYTIVGYITQTEMNNARQELENKAMQYLEDNSEPKVIYEVNSVYIQEKEFEVGDRLTLHDFKQNIDTQVRVVEIQKDLIKTCTQR